MNIEQFKVKAIQEILEQTPEATKDSLIFKSPVGVITISDNCNTIEVHLVDTDFVDYVNSLPKTLLNKVLVKYYNGKVTPDISIYKSQRETFKFRVTEVATKMKQDLSDEITKHLNEVDKLSKQSEILEKFV